MPENMVRKLEVPASEQRPLHYYHKDGPRTPLAKFSTYQIFLYARVICEKVVTIAKNDCSHRDKIDYQKWYCKTDFKGISKGIGRKRGCRA